MNGRSKCLSGLVFPPSKECFQFRKQKEITWGKVLGIRGGGGGGGAKRGEANMRRYELGHCHVEDGHV